MNIKKLTGISLIALGVMTPVFAESTQIAVVEQTLPKIDFDNIQRKILQEREMVTSSEKSFKDEAIRRAQKGEFISIDLLAHQTDEYKKALEIVKNLHVEHVKKLEGFKATTDADLKLKNRRDYRQEVQKELDDLDLTKIDAAILTAKTVSLRTEELEGEISLLESKIEKQTSEKTRLVNEKKGKANETAKASDKVKNRIAATFDTKISEIDVLIKTDQKKITELNIELNTEKSVNSGSTQKGEARKKRTALQESFKKKVKDVNDLLANEKKDQTKSLTEKYGGRVSRKDIHIALKSFVTAYTDFVEKFGGAEQNCSITPNTEAPSTNVQSPIEPVKPDTRDTVTAPTPTASNDFSDELNAKLKSVRAKLDADEAVAKLTKVESESDFSRTDTTPAIIAINEPVQVTEKSDSKPTPTNQKRQNLSAPERMLIGQISDYLKTKKLPKGLILPGSCSAIKGLLDKEGYFLGMKGEDKLSPEAIGQIKAFLNDKEVKGTCSKEMWKS